MLAIILKAILTLTISPLMHIYLIINKGGTNDAPMLKSPLIVFFLLLKDKFAQSKSPFIPIPLGIVFTTLKIYFAFKMGLKVIFLYRSLVWGKANQCICKGCSLHLHLQPWWNFFHWLWRVRPRVGMYQGRYGYHWER